MDTAPTIARRTALTAGLAGVGALTLAACGSSGTSNSAEQPGTTRGADQTTTEPTTGTSGASGVSGGSTGSSASTGSGGTTVIALDDVKEGESAAAKIGSDNVLVYRSGASSAVCFSAVCTHEGCQVKPAGAQLDCPCHQSVFDAKTGKVVSGPAPSPLPQIKVTVEGGNVVTA